MGAKGLRVRGPDRLQLEQIHGGGRPEHVSRCQCADEGWLIFQHEKLDDDQ